NDGVDIYQGKDLPYFVGNLEDGEWMEYSVLVQTGGSFNLELTLAADSTAGIFSLTSGRLRIADGMTIPANGGQWQTLTIKNIHLEEGIHHLRFQVVKGGFRFARMVFTKN